MYKIKLEHFEGPLDLLLFFIKRDELDIYDIPIHTITGEFLQYVHLIQMLDLETAGDFILLASTLMHIKARMLLPREVDEKGEEIDPRTELVERLLEYKQFKEMSEEMSDLEAEQRRVSFRGNYEYDEKIEPPDLETVLRNVTIFDLAKAFRKAIESVKPEPVHQIKKVNVSIDEQMTYLTSKLEAKKEVHFRELLSDMREKIRLVVTFIALLEMAKMGKIGIKESEHFNDFVIYRNENG